MKLSNAELHPISSKGLMHQKIIVLDEELVFLGSANFTTPSLKMHDNLVIGFRDKEIASFLKENAPLKSGYFEKTLDGQKIELWLLPEKGALQDLIHKMRTAKYSLQIALFTLTHPELVEEMIEAKKRGVEVTVILDMHSSLGASSKAFQRLQNEGVDVLLSQGLQLMHHKFAYIDEKVLITGSANWTKSAFTKNQDCLIALSPVTKDQNKTLKNVWSNLKVKAIEPNR